MPVDTFMLHTPLVAPSVIVQLIPAGALVIVALPREVVVGVTVRVAGIAAATKVAATVVVVPGSTGALQFSPLHEPLNPANDPFPELTALSATTMPEANTAEQVPLVVAAAIEQEMPLGTLVTTPVPLPPPVTLIVPGGAGMRYVTSTVRCPLIVTRHGFPVQAVLHA